MPHYAIITFGTHGKIWVDRARRSASWIPPAAKRRDDLKVGTVIVPENTRVDEYGMVYAGEYPVIVPERYDIDEIEAWELVLDSAIEICPDELNLDEWLASKGVPHEDDTPINGDRFGRRCVCVTSYRGDKSMMHENLPPSGHPAVVIATRRGAEIGATSTAIGGVSALYEGQKKKDPDLWILVHQAIGDERALVAFARGFADASIPRLVERAQRRGAPYEGDDRRIALRAAAHAQEALCLSRLGHGSAAAQEIRRAMDIASELSDANVKEAYVDLLLFLLVADGDTDHIEEIF